MQIASLDESAEILITRPVRQRLQLRSAEEAQAARSGTSARPAMRVADYIVARIEELDWEVTQPEPEMPVSPPGYRGWVNGGGLNCSRTGSPNPG